MTPEGLASAAVGFVFGLSFGIWRTWAFARKLVHMGVSLDRWSNYHEPTRQARRAEPVAVTVPPNVHPIYKADQ